MKKSHSFRQPPSEQATSTDRPVEFDSGEAVARLIRFLEVEGITGQEKAVAEEVRRALAEAGVPRRAMQFDSANTRIPLPTQTGNLIVRLAGTLPGPHLLFMTHLDTVPLCAGAKPLLRGRRVLAAGKTALGGDNRTGVACLVTLATTLVRGRLPHPPLTLLFTVREESGLWGARCVDLAALGQPVYGFNVDGSSPAGLTIGAVGADRWEAEIMGRAAHAGTHPEQGVSATMVACLALADVRRGGWFGRIKQGDKEGTANVGSFSGRDGGPAGSATNVVTDYVKVKGESRSHDTRFVHVITQTYRNAFREAARQVTDDHGRQARIRFHSRRDYYPFRLKPGATVVRHALAAAKYVGLEPFLRLTDGGLDANWMVRHGIPTVTFGAGQHNIHAVGEYVDIDEYLAGCRLALALVCRPAPNASGFP